MIKKFLPIILIVTLAKCNGQPNGSPGKLETLNSCNQRVYGSKEYIKNLPVYICIPEGYVIDDYIRWSDLDGDGEKDFLAVKYNKKEDDQLDGDFTYWNFYIRHTNDTLYKLRHKLANIVPPFIKDYGLEYVSKHPKADSIFKLYPRRVSHNLAFVVHQDTLRLSYKFDDSYGKTFVFLYNRARNNWFLKNVQYFIGELPIYWWQDEEFYYPLNDKLKVIEDRQPKYNVAIDEFDLREAFKYRQNEWVHLSEHVDEIDKSTVKSILKINFKRCGQMMLPHSWSY